MVYTPYASNSDLIPPHYKMKKIPIKNTYRYPKNCYAGLIISLLVLVFVGKGLISEALRLKNDSFTILMIVILSGLTYICFKIWQECRAMVVITPDNITIKGPFQSITFKWSNIFEVGRLKKRYYWEKFPSYRWYFYIKGHTADAKRVIIANEFMPDIRALLATLFVKASNAKFVTISDTSIIPFCKSDEVSLWDKTEDLAQYDNH